MKMEYVKAIIFDWDSTIINSFDHLMFCHQEVGRQLGWPTVTDEQMRAVWGKPFEELIQVLWPKRDPRDFEKAYQKRILKETAQEVEGAIMTITKLKNFFQLGIVTAAPRFEVEHFLPQLGLSKADFFIIQAAGESQHHKPDSRVFDTPVTLLQKQNIGKNEILYVGDSLYDFYAARDASLQFIAVLTGSTIREQFRDAGVNIEMIINSIADIPRRLKYLEPI